MHKEAIIHYYETCENDYRLLWDLDHSRAMHAGFWDETTKSLRDALRRENEVLAQMADIKSTDKILDAGCGVGGSAIYLAQHYGCKVVGVTLSDHQVRKARQYALDANLTDLVSFHVMDYQRTSFPDQSFDVIWGIESICHAPDKRAFVKEAARLLKPGGRIIIADGFALQNHYEQQDLALMQRWLRGWGVDSLETASNFHAYLKENRFQDILFQDVTQRVWPSAKRLYLYSWPAIILSKLGEWFSLRTKIQTENLFSARCQYMALKKGLWYYGIFLGKRVE